ncbi:MAG TPA: thermonuclease family protein [Vicinamibacterales bacterium]|nr:thermonuclease family protein [Vicinamibacterales bacterium]
MRAVIDADTIDVAQAGRVRLLGIDAATPLANLARERLTGLVLQRWVRLERDDARTGGRARRSAYVVTGDGVCVNAVLVREGLARVTAQPSLVRFAEFKDAEAEARRLEKGIWSATASPDSPGYTRRPASRPKTPTPKSPKTPPKQEKRRSS